MAEARADTKRERHPSNVSDDEVDDVDYFFSSSQAESVEYCMTHKTRGLALIINNRHFHPQTNLSERRGTDKDAEQLTSVLQTLGFLVQQQDNLIAADMISVLKQAASRDYSNADCFVCVILSHGDVRGIYGTDTVVPAETLFNTFKGHKCKSLADKPKLFFIQACRGTKLDTGVDIVDSDVTDRSGDEMDSSSKMTDNQPIHRIPVEANFLTVYSVLPGYFSWRNRLNGSYFIRALCKVLKEDGFQQEIMVMLTKVNRIMAYKFESTNSRKEMDKKKQVPCIVSTLTKALYFRT